jgi:hypothetical protein
MADPFAPANLACLSLAEFKHLVEANPPTTNQLRQVMECHSTEFIGHVISLPATLSPDRATWLFSGFSRNHNDGYEPNADVLQLALQFVSHPNFVTADDAVSAVSEWHWPECVMATLLQDPRADPNHIGNEWPHRPIINAIYCSVQEGALKALLADPRTDLSGLSGLLHGPKPIDEPGLDIILACPRIHIDPETVASVRSDKTFLRIVRSGRLSQSDAMQTLGLMSEQEHLTVHIGILLAYFDLRAYTGSCNIALLKEWRKYPDEVECRYRERYDEPKYIVASMLKLIIGVSEKQYTLNNIHRFFDICGQLAPELQHRMANLVCGHNKRFVYERDFQLAMLNGYD